MSLGRGHDRRRVEADADGLADAPRAADNDEAVVSGPVGDVVRRSKR
jgi:hypothetical protein